MIYSREVGRSENLGERVSTWSAAPYPVRPWPYLDFEKEKAAAAAPTAPVAPLKCIQNQQLMLILYKLLNQMRVVKNIRRKDDRMNSL